MEFVVNGEKLTLEVETTLIDFIQSKGLRPELIVIEYNGQITAIEEWAGIILKENDSIEILRFVGGG